MGETAVYLTPVEIRQVRSLVFCKIELFQRVFSLERFDIAIFNFFLLFSVDVFSFVFNSFMWLI